MAEKGRVVVDWDAEQKKIEEEYRKKLSELKKMREENEMVDKILTRGILPILILNIISKQPSNGNELSTKVSEVTHGSWQPSTGGIYPILKRFEKQGYITGKWDDPDKRVKKTYTITEKGMLELKTQSSSLIDSLNKTLKVFNDIIRNFQ